MRKAEWRVLEEMLTKILGVGEEGDCVAKDRTKAAG